MNKEKLLLKFLRELVNLLAGAIFFTAFALLAVFFQWYWFALFLTVICLPLLGFGVTLIYSKFEKKYKDAENNGSE